MRYHLLSHDQQAVILGAGLDGLLTARVLIEHFRRVTVITPDTLPAEPALPADIWQALPAHILAVQGYRSLERLFPGLTAELMVAGAPTVEWTADAVTLLPNGWAPRFHSDLISRPVTPNLLEYLIRQRLLDYAGGRVVFLEGREIVALRRNGARMTVIIAPRSQDSTSESLVANLVVDATGRRTQLPDWLARSGLPQPGCTVIPGRLGLSARLYRRPPNYQSGWQALLAVAQDGQPGGVLIPVEADHWLVTLAAPGMDAPDDEAGFLELARHLRTPVLYDAVQRALPLTPVLSLPDAGATRWHLQRLADWPDSLLITGAGAVAFNPAYGFDLTAATVTALVLRDSLEEQRKRQPDGQLNGMSRRFFDRLARACSLPWRWMNAGASSAAAARPDFWTRMARWYGNHLLASARTEASVYQTLLGVAGLAAPSRALFSPALLHRALWPSAAAQTSDVLPPAFEPVHVHKTITQEIASAAGGKSR